MPLGTMRFVSLLMAPIFGGLLPPRSWAASFLGDVAMWDYLLYALFLALLIGCLRYVVSAFETEEMQTKRPDIDQNR